MELTSFSNPKVHAILEGKVAGACGQVFFGRMLKFYLSDGKYLQEHTSEVSKRTSGMFELATVRPLLGFSSEVGVPGKGCSSMLAPNSVMGVKAHLYVGV
jgi:hypothetical protein